MTTRKTKLTAETIDTKTTDWHRIQTSDPVNREAALGIGGYNSESSISLNDVELDKLIAERDALIKEKQANLSALTSVRLDIRRVKEEYHRHGTYIDPGRFADLEFRAREGGLRDQEMANRLRVLKQAIHTRSLRLATIDDDGDPVALLKLALKHISRAIDLIVSKR